MLVLMPVVLSFLNSCTTECYNTCPVYPVAGKSVARELSGLDEEQYSDTWEWIGRINKLREELDICNKIEKRL